MWTLAELQAHYCRAQVVWLIANRELFREGRRPPDPTPTGYTSAEAGVQTSLRAEWAGARVIEAWAEISQRLARTGEDGRVLVHEIDQGLTRYAEPAFWALLYCCGYRRKRTGYQSWKRGRERDQRERAKVFCRPKITRKRVIDVLSK